MQPMTKSEKILGITTGILTAIQAIISWTLSTICLIYYYKDEDVDTSLPISVSRAIHLRFLVDKYSYKIATQGTLIGPPAFAAFNLIYIVFDVLWFYFSCKLVFIVAKESPNIRGCLRKFFTSTHIICLVDLLLVVGLGIDHGKTCTGSISELESELCKKAVIPVLVIFAKGFVLWILNVCLAWACFRKDFGEPSTGSYFPIDGSIFTNNLWNNDSYYGPRYRLEYRLGHRWTGHGYHYRYGLDWVYR